MYFSKVDEMVAFNTETRTLEIVNLGCSRAGRRIFENVNFSLKSGKLLTIEGRNGSGKTSLLRIIAGLLRHDVGDISISGSGMGECNFENFHFVGHKEGLKAALTVSETLKFWQVLLGKRKASISAALEIVGLSQASLLPCSYLSAGQRRRLVLARLLVSDRPIWLLDEPMSALDSTSKTMLENVLMDHLSEGGIGIIATHEHISIPHQTLSLGFDK
ncbi:MAG: heme ABC exporter ATP-binding protein CcmA [Hyphomicrobiales bacterium]